MSVEGGIGGSGSYIKNPVGKLKKKKGEKKRETIQRFVLLLVKIILELAGTTQEASQGE